MAEDKQEEKGQISFTGSLDIDQVEECCKKLNEAFSDGGEVRLDVSGVTSIDASGLQLLIAARKQAHADGTKFIIKGDLPPNVKEFRDYLDGRQLPNEDTVIQTCVEAQ